MTNDPLQASGMESGRRDLHGPDHPDNHDGAEALEKDMSRDQDSGAVPSASGGASESTYLPLVYQPEIDGLRAVAVLSVVCFHAGLSCPGGFVGVDVFFVISGYLITSLLVKSQENDTFSLAGFLERRLRRIFPACAVMVLATLVAGFFLLGTKDYFKLGQSGMAQTLMSANLYFKKQRGYFSEDTIQPLLHTWSLAVEEQFYIVLPLVLTLLGAGRKGRITVLRNVVAGLAAVSFALSVILLPSSGRSVFYLLPMRSWELLCGALLAVLPASWLITSRVWRNATAVAGLLAVLLPVWLYSKATLFPGAAALPPCLGACAIIWANKRSEHPWSFPTWPGRVLANPLLVFIGLISYSLYLWHWPVLAYMYYGILDMSSVPVQVRLAPVLLSFAMAYLSWRWVETPFRKRRLCADRKSMFIGSGAATAVLLAASGVILLWGGFPSRLPAPARTNELVEDDRGFTGNIGVEQIKAGAVPRIGSKSPDAPVRFLVWGDSHAMYAAAAMDDFCRMRGCSAELVTHSATPPLLGASFSRSGMGRLARNWSEAVLQHIKEAKTGNVVLAARWSIYELEDPVRFERSFRETVGRLSSMGCRVWVLQDVPDLDVNVPVLMLRESFGFKPTWYGDWRRTEERHRRKNAVVYRLATEGLPAVFIDPAEVMLDGSTRSYVVARDGVSMYRDDDHLSARGARLILLPLLLRKIGAGMEHD